ncbi:MAG TPA: glycosyltransferase [Anaerolineales bacterium]|nr:glycosyltransferase [Anaerolineales bacterium]
MRILFVVDGRSPIALNWINYFVEQGDEVHLVSTFSCQPDMRVASFHVVPVALSATKGSGERISRKEGTKREILWGARMVGLRTKIRQWIGPFTLSRAATGLRKLLREIQPDLIHAMRIPFEGMLAASALEGAGNKDIYLKRIPLLISVWGNDFTLHAPSTPFMRRYTRRTLRRVDGLHTDCRRDLRLAPIWGFSESKLAVVLPGAGGVQPEIFHPPRHLQRHAKENAPPLVINPRGFRAYIRNDTFFRSIPLVLKSNPRVHFICPAMADEVQARRWVVELDIGRAVTLLSHQSRSQMADLFRKSCIAVSPSTHDGTPNTLLEAMACGCFPIAGNLESLREWITPGKNGFLISPDDPHDLAAAILRAIGTPELLRGAESQNLHLIREQALYPQVMARARAFYQDLIYELGRSGQSS